MQNPKYLKQCSWPIGDPKEDHFHFCGKDTENKKVYCEYHRALSLKPKDEE